MLYFITIISKKRILAYIILLMFIKSIFRKNNLSCIVKINKTKTMFKYVIYYFNIQLPEGLEPVAEYGFNMALVSLSTLFCFISIFGYLINIFILKYYNLENKYPYLKFFFNRFEKTSLIFILIEGVIGFGGLLGIIYLGFYPLFF